MSILSFQINDQVIVPFTGTKDECFGAYNQYNTTWLSVSVHLLIVTARSHNMET